MVGFQEVMCPTCAIFQHKLDFRCMASITGFSFVGNGVKQAQSIEQNNVCNVKRIYLDF